MNSIEKPFTKLNFLVVDDDPVGLDMISTLLKHYGANTFTADNGLTGLMLIRELKPDVVISDLSMPVMNGWKMIAELKHDNKTMDIPIIALTAHAMRGDREKAMSIGCHNYLTKPIDPYTFIAQLQSILDEIPGLGSTSEEDKAKIDSAISEHKTDNTDTSSSEVNASTTDNAKKADDESKHKN